jgi:hypothetical protein
VPGVHSTLVSLADGNCQLTTFPLPVKIGSARRGDSIAVSAIWQLCAQICQFDVSGLA